MPPAEEQRFTDGDVTHIQEFTDWVIADLTRITFLQNKWDEAEINPNDDCVTTALCWSHAYIKLWHDSRGEHMHKALQPNRHAFSLMRSAFETMFGEPRATKTPAQTAYILSFNTVFQAMAPPVNAQAVSKRTSRARRTLEYYDDLAWGEHNELQDQLKSADKAIVQGRQYASLPTRILGLADCLRLKEARRKSRERKAALEECESHIKRLEKKIEDMHRWIRYVGKDFVAAERGDYSTPSRPKPMPITPARPGRIMVSASPPSPDRLEEDDEQRVDEEIF